MAPTWAGPGLFKIWLGFIQNGELDIFAVLKIWDCSEKFA